MKRLTVLSLAMLALSFFPAPSPQSLVPVANAATVTLNGHTYNSDDFKGYGYTKVFPTPILTDMMVEIQNALAMGGGSGGTGTAWLYGSSAPSDSVGAMGSWYFCTTTYDIYVKGATSWGTPIANIKGTPGAPGTSSGSVSFQNTSTAWRTGATSAASKTTPVNNDWFSFWDSVTGGLRKLTWSNLITALNGLFQPLLGFTPENAANKSNSTSLGTSATLYPTQNAVKSYVDTGLATKQATLGFTAENSANKDTDGTLAANSDAKYPSQKAVKTYVDAHAGGTITNGTTPMSGFTGQGFVYNNSGVAGYASPFACWSSNGVSRTCRGSGAGGLPKVFYADGSGCSTVTLAHDDICFDNHSSAGGSGGSGTTTFAVTFNNSGSGATSGATFDGSASRTISYNTIGAQPAGSYLTSESDPKVGSVTNGNFCKGTGTQVSCTDTTPYMPASKIGTVTNTKYCVGDGSGNVQCTADGTSISSNISDTAYDATSWDGDTTNAPSKNAVRDKAEAMETEIAGKIASDGTVRKIWSSSDCYSLVSSMAEGDLCVQY